MLRPPQHRPHRFTTASWRRRKVPILSTLLFVMFALQSNNRHTVRQRLHCSLLNVFLGETCGTAIPTAACVAAQKLCFCSHSPSLMRKSTEFRASSTSAVLDMGEGRHVEDWYGKQMHAEPPSEEDELMNYGLYTDPIHPAAADHKQAHMANMYAILVNSTRLAGKRVLEVGSGRGGGAAVLSKWHQPALYVGMDLVATQVSSANRRLANFQSSHLVFVQGDAQDIPFPDNSFDVVINVESSHNYPEFTKFLTEVHRVLDRNGTFLMEDFRNDDADMDGMIASLRQVFGDDVVATNMSSSVLASMEMRSAYLDERIAQCGKFASREYCYWYWWGGGTLPTFMFQCQVH